MSIMKPPFHTELNLGHRLSQDIVGCWLFNEAPPPLGSAMDLSGNGNHGTLVGDTHSVAGKFGPALDFDGIGDDVVSIPDTEQLRFNGSTESFSIVAVVRTSDSFVNRAIVDKEEGSNDGWRFIIAGGPFWFSVGSADVKSSLTPVNNTWYHVAATLDRTGNGQIYIDGLANGLPVSVSGITMATTNPVGIGLRARDGGHAWLGQIDHVYIYNRALNGSEIASLYLDPFQMFKRNL